MRQGTFITVEGVDKLANSSQVELLSARLQKAGFDVVCFDFAELGEPAGHFVKQYLEGKYGSEGEVGPYTSSLFYALNRYHTAAAIRAALENGAVVLATNFTGDSMANQGSTFANAEERRGFFIWLDNLEFQMLRLPRPDKTFILRMPVEGLSGQFRTLVTTFDDLCQLFPKDFIRVDYVRSGKSMDTAQLNDFIWKFAEPLLPKVKTRAATQQASVPPSIVFVPQQLEGAVRETYTEAVGKILEIRRQVGQSLSKMIDITTREKEVLLEDMLPVGAYRSPAEQASAQALTDLPDSTHTQLAKLKETYSTQTQTITLVDRSPRNELDVLPELIYSHSGLSKQQLTEQVSKWSYQDKADYFASQKPKTVLQHLHYDLELLLPYRVVAEMRSLKGLHVTTQSLSPRYGFGVPSKIEDEDLIEQYEEVFELSLKLHSDLQEKGYENIAQLAVLRGHKVRINLRLGGAAMQALVSHFSKNNMNDEWLHELREKLEEVHPLALKHYELI